MSDELRDMLEHRADAIDVPSGDVTSVVAAGRSIKARRFAMAGAASVVVIALVAWGSTGGRVFDRGNGEVADPGPTATDDGHVAGACEQVSFRPGYLPEGWDYVLREGEGGQQGVPLDEQSPRALGFWGQGTSDGPGSVPGFIDVFEYDSAPYPNIANPETIRVLGTDGVIGDVHEGYGVTFTYEGCRWVLNAFGPPKSELRKVATNLHPREECRGDDVLIPVADDVVAPSERRFGSIEALDHTRISIDEAEFLTGEEAQRAAIEDGYIQEGEAVPNDYYINDDNSVTEGLPVSRDVVVMLETYRQDGNVGLAQWEYPEFVCMFGSEDMIESAVASSWFWFELEDGIVTKIEEQYVP